MLEEKDIQKSCLNWLLHIPEVWAWRNNSTGIFDHERGFYRTAPKRGAPDIIAVYKGKFIGIEIKRPKGKQSQEQRWFEEGVRSAGGDYWLIHSLEELREKWLHML